MNNQAFRSCWLVLAALAIAWMPLQAQGQGNILTAEQIAIRLAPTKGLRPVNSSAKNLPAAIRPGDRPSVDLPSVTFNFGSFELTNDARQQLNELAKALAMPAFKNSRFIIGGHTDARGSEAFNKMLSEQRAEAVVAYLAGKSGLGALKLVPIGWGKSRLLPEISPDDSRQRRAEIINIGTTK